MILVSYLVPTYTGFYSNTTLKAFFTRSHIHPFTHIIIKFLLCTLNYFFLSCYHMHTWTPVDGVWVSWSRTPRHAHESAAHQTCSSFWLVDNPLNFFSHIFFCLVALASTYHFIIKRVLWDQCVILGICFSHTLICNTCISATAESRQGQVQ